MNLCRHLPCQKETTEEGSGENGTACRPDLARELELQTDFLDLKATYCTRLDANIHDQASGNRGRGHGIQKAGIRWYARTINGQTETSAASPARLHHRPWSVCTFYANQSVGTTHATFAAESCTLKWFFGGPCVEGGKVCSTRPSPPLSS